MEFRASGKKIKELRLRSGFSQNELAEVSGLSLRSIQRIENEDTIARGDSLRRISKALNVNIEELTSDTEPTYPDLSNAHKQDRRIPLLLILSAFAYLYNPVLGVVLPTAVWLLFRNNIESVKEVGIRTIRVELIWCGLLTLIYIYFFSKKFLNLNLPVPNNPKSPVIFILAMYILNACALCVLLITWIMKRPQKTKAVVTS